MEIDISKLTAYTAKFTRVFTGAQRTDILTQVGRRIGAAAVRIAAEYPEPSRKPLPKIYQRVNAKGVSYLSKFKSQKQQVKVIMLAKEGKIPYRRTGLLGKSMTSSISSVTLESVTIQVGTNVPYGPQVMGENQNPYFRGTWMTLPAKMNANAEKLKTVAEMAYTTEIDKRLTP